MKVLYCTNTNFEIKTLPLCDINSVNDNLQDKVFDNTLKKSLESKGMLNPLLVCRDEDFKTTDIRRFERRQVPEDIDETYRCMIGNNRYKYAIDNGFTHIDCHIVKTYDDLKKAHVATQIEPRKM